MAKAKKDGARRRSSFATRLMSSISEWGRKTYHGNSNYHSNHDSTEDDVDSGESHNNNKRESREKTMKKHEKNVNPEEEPQNLTTAQRELLKESWLIVKHDVAVVGVETFMGLFNTHPDAKDSFLAFKDYSIENIQQSAVLKAHALRVMQTVDKCVSRLEDPQKMTEVIYSLGLRHGSYDAKSELVPVIGIQFISAIEPKLKDMWSVELKAAWEDLFRIINFYIRKGMDTD